MERSLPRGTARCYSFAFMFVERVAIVVISSSRDGEHARKLAARSFGVRRQDIKYATSAKCSSHFHAPARKLSPLALHPDVCVLFDPPAARDAVMRIDPYLDTPQGKGFTVDVLTNQLRQRCRALDALPSVCEMVLANRLADLLGSQVFTVEAECSKCGAVSLSAGTGLNVRQPFECSTCKNRLCQAVEVIRCSSKIAAYTLDGSSTPARVWETWAGLMLQSIRSGDAVSVKSLLLVIPNPNGSLSSAQGTREPSRLDLLFCLVIGCAVRSRLPGVLCMVLSKATDWQINHSNRDPRGGSARRLNLLQPHAEQMNADMCELAAMAREAATAKMSFRRRLQAWIVSITEHVGTGFLGHFAEQVYEAGFTCHQLRCTQRAFEFFEFVDAVSVNQI
eukprot:TRINITY_DN8686_c0_g1_i1.p1 TRINITY_DN8686_c0_g1~~TRINITY_DN8686_c0_g1_i1.p1  ORF type:complete len:393 (+),score=56.59 TRINITY_DN8686_c0_g1_i1:224-1402(+)